MTISKKPVDKKQKGGATAAMSSILGAVQLDQAKPQPKIIEAKTSECRMWGFADRPEEEAEHIDDVGKSMKKSGQIHPALARPCNDPTAPHIKYEIIVGNVRWQACKQIGMPIRLEVKNIDDMTANRIMFDENDKRKGISIYARSLHLARCLEKGLYKSKKELSDHLEISASTLSYHLAFASLPDFIIKALGKGNMRPISLSMGYRLAQAVEKLPEDDVLELIPDIQSGDLSAAQLDALIARETGRPKRSYDPPEPRPEETSGYINLPGEVVKLGPGEEEGGGNTHDESNEEPNDESQSSGDSGETLTTESSKKINREPPNPKIVETQETDLGRAHKLRGRINDHLSVVCSAEGTIVFSSDHPGLTDFLIQEQRYIKDQLLKKLKEEAVLFLEAEVPLSLFDDVGTEGNED